MEQRTLKIKSPETVGLVKDYIEVGKRYSSASNWFYASVSALVLTVETTILTLIDLYSGNLDKLTSDASLMTVIPEPASLPELGLISINIPPAFAIYATHQNRKNIREEAEVLKQKIIDIEGEDSELVRIMEESGMYFNENSIKRHIQQQIEEENQQRFLGHLFGTE